MKLFEIVVAIKAETAVMARSAVPIDGLEHCAPAIARAVEAHLAHHRDEMRAAIARVRAQLNQLEALL